MKMLWAVLLFTLASFAPCQTKPKTVIIDFGNDKHTNVPLKIDGYVRSVADEAERLTVVNLSSKDVQAFQLGWSISIPPQCASNPGAPPTLTFGPIEQLAIAAGKSVNVGPYKIPAPDLMQVGVNAGATTVHVQFGVLNVSFADGTKWTNTPAIKTRVFDENVQKKTKCLLPAQADSMRQGLSITPNLPPCFATDVPLLTEPRLQRAAHLKQAACGYCVEVCRFIEEFKECNLLTGDYCEERTCSLIQITNGSCPKKHCGSACFPG